MGGRNAQKAKMAREKNLEKAKGSKGSQLDTNEKAKSMSIQAITVDHKIEFAEKKLEFDKLEFDEIRRQRRKAAQERDQERNDMIRNWRSIFPWRESESKRFPILPRTEDELREEQEKCVAKWRKIDEVSRQMKIEVALHRAKVERGESSGRCYITHCYD